MKLFSRIVLCLFVIAAIIGCASSTITSRQEYQGGKIARPDHIIVYDFAATPADVRPSRLLQAKYEHATPQTAEQIEVRWARKSQKFWLRIFAAWDCRQSGLRVKLCRKLAIL